MKTLKNFVRYKMKAKNGKTCNSAGIYTVDVANKLLWAFIILGYFLNTG